MEIIIGRQKNTLKKQEEIIKIEKLYIFLNNPMTANYGLEIHKVRYAIGRCSSAKKSILLNKL